MQHRYRAGRAALSHSRDPTRRQSHLWTKARLAYITAWVPGRIDDLLVDYTGVTVRKGDHMVELYSPELLLRARRAAASHSRHDGALKKQCRVVAPLSGRHG